ncbi:MAG: efflux RND transporter permease subunit [Ancalomicrobiaceae bacterium]|nr:efflux RND transporter permease subunit [Ancalomicrobiaceae bacterium]
MNLSRAFIARPVGTILMAVGLFLAGVVAYVVLPVASLPSVDFPTIRVMATRPGADPETMAATVAAPLERRLGGIAGVTELTSSSSLGSTSIIVQFSLDRSLDGAGRDVQAALNAAATDLPGDLPSLPQFRKFNPASMPVLILALTSKTMPPSKIYDLADTVIAQRLAQVDGVADVAVNGAEQPAVRVRVDPARLAAMGLPLDAIRTAITGANVASPVGAFDGRWQSHVISTTDQISSVEDYRRIIVANRPNGTVVRLGDVATVDQGVRNSYSAGWYDGQPAVLINITKQPNANVIETVDRVKALIPEFANWVPAGLDVAVLTDRSVTIRASIFEIQKTLLISIALVMMVVFVFLRRATPTIAAGITVPLSLAGTTAAMWVAGFTLDNISLMAIIVAVGFVVDDAIVMIENIHRNIEKGMGRLQAAVVGSGQIGFTVISISVSLIAAFIPIFFIGGIAGRVFFEFSGTLTFAILVSTVVSLTVTPMICGHFIRHGSNDRHSWFDRAFEAALNALIRGYAWTLSGALRRPIGMLMVMLATVFVTVDLYRSTPKGAFPQDDTGLIMGFTEAAPDVSFEAMGVLQQRATAVIMADPAVEHIASSLGGGHSMNQGQFYVNLKPQAVRGLTTPQVIARLRGPLQRLAGINVFLVPVQDLRAGGRAGKSAYQYTLWDPDLAELVAWTPKVVAELQKLPGLVDVSTDRNPGGLDAKLVIDRSTASRLGVRIQDIDTVLSDAFGQRQISTIYTQRNQYTVVMEVNDSRRRDPGDFEGLYVPGSGGVQVPLSAVAHMQRGSAPLLVNHQGQFPAITITFDTAPNVAFDTASVDIDRVVANLHLPETLHAEYAGDARDARSTNSNMAVLILVAVLAVYIILGVLYESLIHPITIISTLPSAGLGALLAINAVGSQLSIIAFIGIILLIGIVKKNGIMLVDFALAAEREEGLSPREAIHKACLERFRPILMTTLAALLGALPLALGTGPGAELRRPLGITIVGGLALSQLLTLYTTPVIYLLLDKLRRRGQHPVSRFGHALGMRARTPGE